MASQAELVTLEELIACFDELDDPRSEIKCEHPLESVFAISRMAVRAGTDGPCMGPGERTYAGSGAHGTKTEQERRQFQQF